MQLFSRTIYSKDNKVLIHRVPENWNTQKLIDSLNEVITLANTASKEGYKGLELQGNTIMFSDLKGMYIEYKFLGIPYKYGDLK